MFGRAVALFIILKLQLLKHFPKVPRVRAVLYFKTEVVAPIQKHSSAVTVCSQNTPPFFVINDKIVGKVSQRRVSKVQQPLHARSGAALGSRKLRSIKSMNI